MVLLKTCTYKNTSFYRHILKLGASCETVSTGHSFQHRHSQFLYNGIAIVNKSLRSYRNNLQYSLMFSVMKLFIHVQNRVILLKITQFSP